MLVLMRNLKETIVIGDEIRVTVVGIDRHDVSLGIEAPKAVPIHREEIYRRLQEKKPQEE